MSRNFYNERMIQVKLWGGRFSKNTDSEVNDFNSSIRFDQRLYRQDILGSIAHAKMLGKCKIIDEESSKLIIKTLKEILADIEDGKVEFMIDAEDIHMNVETMLIKKIGFDPAVVASPFITTILDALCLFIYFQIARGLLGI